MAVIGIINQPEIGAVTQSILNISAAWQSRAAMLTQAEKGGCLRPARVDQR